MREPGTASARQIAALELFTVRLLACRDASERGALTLHHVAALGRAAEACRALGTSDVTAANGRAARLRDRICRELDSLAAPRGGRSSWTQALLADASIDLIADTLRCRGSTDRSRAVR